MTTNIHAHVATHSRDCDGGHGDEYIVWLNEDERAEHAEGEARGYNDFHEIHFRNRVVGNVVNSYSIMDGVTGTLEVTAFGLTWNEPTDEGYRGSEVRWCDSRYCTDPTNCVYDEFAQAAGY